MFAVPNIAPVQAQVGPIVQCGTGQPDSTTGVLDACDFGDFLQLIQTIIDFMVAIAVPIAVILFTYAGVLYLTDTGKEQNITKAKKIMADTVIGLLIVVSAWLVVRTVVGHLLDNEKFDNPLEETDDSGSSDDNTTS